MENHFINCFKEILNVSNWATSDAIKKEGSRIETVPGIFRNHKREVKSEEYYDFRKKRLEEILNEYSDKLFPLVNGYGDSVFKNENFTTRSTPTFNMISNFCDFVRFAEHVVFFPNNENNKVYVPIHPQENHPCLIIKEDDYYKIGICLDEVKESRYDMGASFKAIKITIVRDWREVGEKVQTLVYFDAIEPLEGFSDEDCWLTGNLITIIVDSCYHLFKDIINSMTAEYGVTLE